MLEKFHTKGLIEAGCDEAGRGCLAGPVVAGAVILPANFSNILLNDSKKLTDKQRYSLRPIIEKEAIEYAVLKRGLQEIMKTLDCAEYLFDGNLDYGIKGLQTMIKADGKVAEVSAASILAKVTHDRDILKEAIKYPEYQFEKHKGYGTKLHVDMIKKHGYCEIHRRSYKLKALEQTLF